MKQHNNIYTILFALALLSACQPAAEPASDSTSSNVGTKTQTVGVVSPEKRSFEAEILISGTAMPDQQTNIHAMESGYVTRIHKDIGEYVTRGQALASMTNPEIAQFYAEASAEVAMAEAELLKIKADKESAEAEYKSKGKLYERLKSIQLATPQLTPIAEVERAEGEAAMAKAKLRALDAQIEAQGQKIEGLKGKLNFAESRRAMLTIKAPFTGWVTGRHIDVGALVQSGISNTSSKAAFDIQDTRTMRLVLPIPESDAVALKKGTEVVVTFPELSGQNYTVKVSRTSNALDPLSKTMQVEVDIPNENGKIISGMYGKAQVKLSNRSDVLSVPLTARILFEDVPHIMVVKDGVVSRVVLKEGLKGKDFVEVLNADITDQTQIIVQGKGQVKPGDQVKAIKQ